jgi:hypothetical protein
MIRAIGHWILVWPLKTGKKAFSTGMTTANSQDPMPNFATCASGPVKGFVNRSNGSKKGKKRKKGKMLFCLFCASCPFCFLLAYAANIQPTNLYPIP